MIGGLLFGSGSAGAVLHIGVRAGHANDALTKFTTRAHNAGKATEHFERTTRNLTNSLGILGTFFGVRQMIEYADTWTLINSRIKLVTKSSEQARAVQMRLADIAASTRNDLAATSVLYTRVALNADQLGRSHEELLTVVESVNAAMLVSGATGVEAAQSIRQLAQALGSGRLQGDEFRTTMEAMPMVARAISDEMGVELGDLYKLSAEGLIDVQTVIDALINSNGKLVDMAKDMAWTTDQAMKVIKTRATQLIGILNMTFGATRSLAMAFLWLADNIAKVFSLLTALTAAGIAYRVAMNGMIRVQATIAAYFALTKKNGLAVIAVNSIMTAARSVRDFFLLATAIRRTADAMALLQVVSMGAMKAIAVIAAFGAGYVAYQMVAEKIAEATREWAEAQGDLTDKLGEGGLDNADEEALRRALEVRREIQDNWRELFQTMGSLSAANELQEKQLEAHYEWIDKIVDLNRRREDGELNDQQYEELRAQAEVWREMTMLVNTYEQELEDAREVLKKHEDTIKRFADNLQRGLGDAIFQGMQEGIDKLQDFFDVIRDMFFRLLADITAAKFMETTRGSLESFLSNFIGNEEERRMAGQRISEIAGIGRSYGGRAVHGLTDRQKDMLEKQYNSFLKNMPTTVDEDKLGKAIGKYAGPALAGVIIGTGIGQMTSNNTLGALGGAAGGAMAGFASAGPVGALVGGFTGAVSGLIGSNERQRQEAERLRRRMEALQITIEANNRRLEELRADFLGGNTMSALVKDFYEAVKSLRPNTQRDMWEVGNLDLPFYTKMSADMKEVFGRMAQELGIKIFDEEGRVIIEAMKQLQEAVELTVRAMLEFGTSIDELRSKQDYYNTIFGIEDSGMSDAYNLLMQGAPELMKQMGLANLDLSSAAARETLREGFKEIFRLIESGGLTLDLLGAFGDKNELLDAIVAVIDAFGALEQELYDITTDFPRAMDLMYYQQKFGTYGLSDRNTFPRTDPGDIPDVGGTYFTVDNINITTDGTESGEDILRKIQSAAFAKRRAGGFVSMGDREGSF